MPLTDHVQELQDDKSHDPGCITKCVGSDFKNHHGSYRKNGYDEIKGNGAKRGIYEIDMSKPSNSQRLPYLIQETPSGGGAPRYAEDPVFDPTAWTFKGDNYKKGYLPYNHDYHHILPWDVISNTMSVREGKLLQQSGYNLNGGKNLIILPKLDAYANAICLYSHLGNHPTYNQDLIDIVNETKQIVNPKPGHKVTQKNVDKIKQLFEDWSDNEFDAIVAEGRKACKKSTPTPMKIDDHPLSDMV